MAADTDLLSDEHPAEPVLDPRPRSRRALLTGAAGGAAALVALLTRPARSQAAAGSSLIIGSEANNAGSANTQLLTNSSVVAFKLLQNGPGTALMGYATDTSGATRGVYGRTDSANGDGVQARNAASTTGTGAAMRAYGVKNSALIATTEVTSGIAIQATNTSAGLGANAGSGIRALCGGGTVADIHPGGDLLDAAGEFAGPIGVIGVSTANNYGVVGKSSTGQGVLGITNNGTGAWGLATSLGTGVYGSSDGGIGVYGESTLGYAGYFTDEVYFDDRLDIKEIATPAAPPVDQARLFVRDSGGKTQLCVSFNTGGVFVLAAQP